MNKNLHNHIRLLKELDDNEAAILPGQPVFVPNKFSKGGRLKFYQIPQNIFKQMAIGNLDKESNDLKGPLTINNYRHRFQTLLWLEEAHQQIEMRRYDIQDVLLGKFSDFFVLPVPGLAEGRPSLMRGDKVFLSMFNSANKYEGYIHDVREADVLIKVHSSLHTTDTDGVHFKVAFFFSRTAFRRCHHGVDMIQQRHISHETIFPVVSQSHSSQNHNGSWTKASYNSSSNNNNSNNFNNTKLNKPLIDLDCEQDLDLIDKKLNLYQRQAVYNVLVGACRPAPYLIFGPPGTGKTVTLVEAILQLFTKNKKARILVCSNSNACTDLLATRLLDSQVVTAKDMLRLSAFYRMEKMIPENLAEVTKETASLGEEFWLDYRIMVTTCIQAGSLYEFLEPGRGFYDAVFIDEAGHANEPETLIPIGLIKKSGLVVLAGDPHQLGPVCMSKIAGDNGLGESLLERLSQRSVYRRDLISENSRYDRKYITKLLINYRSDERVMTINNRLFYDNELKYIVRSPQKCLDAVDAKFPLVFHGVKGHDKREYTNPSWFNPNEAVVCVSYVSRLYAAGYKPEQVGVITPYRRQIDKLETLFESCMLDRCKIATMEEFQGDEREIIIISTVRCEEKNLEHDAKFYLGFLFNPKRFNVAVSRAKWLVVVIGDPELLKRDPCWEQFIRFCKINNSYIKVTNMSSRDKGDDDDNGENDESPTDENID